MEQPPKQESHKEDLDLLEYELEQVNQELTWQHQISEVDKLKIKKKELQEKIKNLKK